MLERAPWADGDVSNLMRSRAAPMPGPQRDGSRANRGMPRYEEMTDQQLVAMQHYIRPQADVALLKK